MFLISLVFTHTNSCRYTENIRETSQRLYLVFIHTHTLKTRTQSEGRWGDSEMIWDSEKVQEESWSLMGFGLVFTCYILIFCLSFYQFTPTILHLRIQNFGILQIFQISCNFYFILLWLNYFPEAKIRLSIVSQKNKLPSKLLFCSGNGKFWDISSTWFQK